MAKKHKENNEKLPIKRLIQNVFFIIGYATKQDRGIVIGFIVASCFFTGANILFDTLLFKLVIDMMSDGTELGVLVATIITGFLILGAAVAVTNYFESVFFTKMSRVIGNTQREFLEKASRIDLICYDNPKYFDDFVIAASQCDEMIVEAVQSVAWVCGSIIGVLLSSGVIFSMNPLVAIFPVLGFVINIVTRFAIIKLEYEFEIEKKKVNRKSDYSKRVFYQPEYAKEIKLSGIADALKKQFDDSIAEERRVARKYGIKIALLSLVNWIMVFTVLSHFCIPVYLGYLALVAMKISLGDVASLRNAAGAVQNLLDSMNYGLSDFQKVGLFAERFRRFVDYKENIEVFKGDGDVPEHAEICIKNMSYRYDGCDEYTLKDINMTIRAGEKIAIVGENGAGKTTLIKLLMRLYDVTEGEITFGGKNICSFTTSEYRKKIAAVFQDYQLYAATLGENVLMDSIPESTEETEKTITDALEKANFTSKLEKLKNGTESLMTKEFSDDGTNLSGGESQKVAISRMFARETAPAVSILDEPSSALDPIAEYKLNCSMMENAKHSTIIFISHRLSTTREADRIYMFEHGEIVEQGTHDELMAKNGEYAEMFEKQAHYYKTGVV